MRRLAYIAAGLVAGILLATSGSAIAAWLVTGHGEAGVSMARLSGLGVDVAKIEGAWPGDEVVVRAVVKNPNGRSLRVVRVDLKALTSDEKGCATGVVFKPKGGLVAAPGETSLDVGTLTFPDTMATRCSGAAMTGDLEIAAAFGA
jgi:hypothetical protein